MYIRKLHLPTRSIKLPIDELLLITNAFNVFTELN